MKKYQVYGIGAALVDTEIPVDEQFLQNSGVQKGYMTLVDEARQHELMGLLEQHLEDSHRTSGGSAANSIITHSYFGGRAFYSCKVAGDENGDFYIDDLHRADVALDAEKARGQGITGKCLVMVTPDAERSMNTFLGISETLSEDNLNLEALKNSEWLYMEGYLVTSETGRKAAITAREYAQAHGVKVALTLSDPGIVEFFKDGLQDMLGEKVELVFCNEHEAKQWAGSDNIDDALAAMKTIANTFIVTQSDKGAFIFDGETLQHVDAQKVEAIDANGAGDAFAGAFLYAITHGFSWLDAGKLAADTAAAVVSQYGPRLSKASYQAILKQHQP